MKAITKLTVATLAGAALVAVAVQITYAHVKSPVFVVNKGGVTGAAASKTYADWEGALTQSFGARVLSHGGPTDALAGGTSRSSVNPFRGMEKMQSVIE